MPIPFVLLIINVASHCFIKRCPTFSIPTFYLDRKTDGEVKVGKSSLGLVMLIEVFAEIKWCL